MCDSDRHTDERTDKRKETLLISKPRSSITERDINGVDLVGMTR